MPDSNILYGGQTPGSPTKNTLRWGRSRFKTCLERTSRTAGQKIRRRLLAGHDPDQPPLNSQVLGVFFLSKTKKKSFPGGVHQLSISQVHFISPCYRFSAIEQVIFTEALLSPQLTTLPLKSNGASSKQTPLS